MKTVQAVGQYIVSFNTSVGDYEVGEYRMNTVDYAGDDVEALAAEVIADDTDFPLVFVHDSDSNGGVVGVFCEAEDPECVVAVMYEY